MRAPRAEDTSIPNLADFSLHVAHLLMSAVPGMVRNSEDEGPAVTTAEDGVDTAGAVATAEILPAGAAVEDVASPEEPESLKDAIGDEDDEGSFDDCLEEDELHNRYVDYSCATGWEYFINDIEELLRRWWKEEGGNEGVGGRTPLCETVSLDETPYRFIWWRSSVSSVGGLPQLEDQSLDFSRRGEAENVQRWFGVRSFLFVWKPAADGAADEAGMDRSEASLILSSLAIALHNCDIHLPVFVPVGRKPYRSPVRDANVFGGLLDVDEMVGYAVPCGFENALGTPCSVRFETSKVFQPPEAYKTLDRFSELFLSKVGFATRLSTGSGGAMGGAGASTNGMMLMGEADGEGLRPRLVVNVEHSWLWEVHQHDWAIPAGEWKDGRVRAPTTPREQNVRDVMTVMQGVLGLSGVEGLGGLWGSAMTDPLEQLCLRVRWLGLQDGTFVENVYYSTLQPLQTDPSAWLVSATFHDHDATPEDPTRSRSPPPSPPKGGLRLKRASGLSPLADTSPLAYLLQSLLASYITAKALSPGTIMSELVSPSSPSKKPKAQDTEQATDTPTPPSASTGMDEEVIRQALTIASHLGPGMSAHLKELSMRDAPPASSITRLTALLFNPDPSTTPAVVDEDADVAVAPHGQLLSLLALACAKLQTLCGMARLWVQVVQELRYRWEQGIPVPRMVPPGDIKGLQWFEPGVQNGGTPAWTCLLQQKLQLLNLCIEKRSAGAKGTPPPPATAAKDAEAEKGQQEEESEGEGDAVTEEDVFLDVVAPPSDTEGDAEEDDAVTVVNSASEGDGGEGQMAPLSECIFLLAKEGAPLMVPACQETCPLTEDAYMQARQLYFRLEREPGRSWEDALGKLHGKLQLPKLKSDMAAFKAANPGCVLADFVRWRAPEQWEEEEEEEEQHQSGTGTPEQGGEQEEGGDGEEIGPLAAKEEEAQGEAGEVATQKEAADAEEGAGEPGQGDEEAVGLGEQGEAQEGGSVSDFQGEAGREEVEESERLVWPGKGFVREGFATAFHLEPQEVKQLWRETEALPASAQEPLFHATQEAEKVLHYLETVSPGHLLCQMLAAAFSTAYFLLNEGQSDARDIPELQHDIRLLRQSIARCLAHLHEEQMSSDVVSLDGTARAQPVSQVALTACQQVCTAMAKFEMKLGRATSLLHKLPDQPRLISLLLSPSHPPTPLHSEDERRSVVQLFGHLKPDAPLSPTVVSPMTPPYGNTQDLDPSSTPSSAPTLHSSAAPAIAAAPAVAPAPASMGSTSTAMLFPEDEDDHFTTPSTAAPPPDSNGHGPRPDQTLGNDGSLGGTGDDTLPLTKVERAHYVLPPAALRTYVLRCKAPTPFHHGLLGGPAGVRQGLTSPPVPSRLYAVVSKAEESVRLALSLSEAEL